MPNLQCPNQLYTPWLHKHAFQMTEEKVSSLLFHLHLFQLGFRRMEAVTLYNCNWQRAWRTADLLQLMERDRHPQKANTLCLTNFRARTQPKTKTGAFWCRCLPPASACEALVKRKLVSAVSGVQKALWLTRRETPTSDKLKHRFLCTVTDWLSPDYYRIFSDRPHTDIASQMTGCRQRES